MNRMEQKKDRKCSAGELDAGFKATPYQLGKAKAQLDQEGSCAAIHRRTGLLRMLCAVRIGGAAWHHSFNAPRPHRDESLQTQSAACTNCRRRQSSTHLACLVDDAAERERFDVLLTTDSNIKQPHNLDRRQVAIPA